VRHGAVEAEPDEEMKMKSTRVCDNCLAVFFRKPTVPPWWLKHPAHWPVPYATTPNSATETPPAFAQQVD
jgi:hypothetical protein